jgi:uncharacterized protein (DUF1778 family)
MPSPKTDRLELRIAPGHHREIKDGAAAVGLSVSAFTLTTTLLAAREVALHTVGDNQLAAMEETSPPGRAGRD